MSLFRTRSKPDRARNIAIGVGLVAAAALANYLIGRSSERRRPPPGRFIDVDGVRLHYIEAGPARPVGAPVLLIHGNGAMAEDFAVSGLFGRLARTRRVVAIDRPGFGYSERPRRKLWNADAQTGIFLKAMQRLGLQRPIVVGHSWGTLVAVGMALESPAEIAGVALLSGYYFPTARLDTAILSSPAVPIAGDLMRYTVSPAIGWASVPAVFKAIFSPAPVSQNFRDRYPTGLSLRPWQLRAVAADTGYMIPDAAKLAPRYEELTLPTLIVSGVGDRIVAFDSQSKRLAEALPHAEFLALDGGHMIHHIAPDEVIAALERLAVRAAPTANVQALTRAGSRGRTGVETRMGA